MYSSMRNTHNELCIGFAFRNINAAGLYTFNTSFKLWEKNNYFLVFNLHCSFAVSITQFDTVVLAKCIACFEELCAFMHEEH